jgi:hypothetical protein
LNDLQYMRKNCPKSCNSCAKTKEENQSNAPKKNKLTVQDESETYGDRQKVEGAEGARTIELAASSFEYMKSDEVLTLPAKIRDNCRNKHQLCSFWAVIGKRIKLFLLIEWTTIMLTLKFSSSFGLFRRM